MRRFFAFEFPYRLEAINSSVRFLIEVNVYNVFQIPRITAVASESSYSCLLGCGLSECLPSCRSVICSDNGIPEPDIFDCRPWETSDVCCSNSFESMHSYELYHLGLCFFLYKHFYRLARQPNELILDVL